MRSLGTIIKIYNKNQKCIDEIKLAADTFRNQFKDYFKGYSYKNIDLLEDNLTFEEPLKGSSRNLVSCYQAGTIINEVYDVNDLDEKNVYWKWMEITIWWKYVNTD